MDTYRPGELGEAAIAPYLPGGIREMTGIPSTYQEAVAGRLLEMLGK